MKRLESVWRYCLVIALVASSGMTASASLMFYGHEFNLSRDIYEAFLPHSKTRVSTFNDLKALAERKGISLSDSHKGLNYLHLAMTWGASPEIIDGLIGEGANPNQQFAVQMPSQATMIYTPLTMPRGTIDNFLRLIEVHGADILPETINDGSYTIVVTGLDVAYTHVKQRASPGLFRRVFDKVAHELSDAKKDGLWVRAFEDGITEVMLALLDYGYDVNTLLSKDKGTALFQLSGDPNKIELFRLILKHGANPNVQTRMDASRFSPVYSTPLLNSIVKNNQDAFDALIYHPDIDLTLKDPLSVAVYFDRAKMIDILLVRSAEYCADSFSKMLTAAIDVAMEKKQSDLVFRLMKVRDAHQTKL